MLVCSCYCGVPSAVLLSGGVPYMDHLYVVHLIHVVLHDMCGVCIICVVFSSYMRCLHHM